MVIACCIILLWHTKSGQKEVLNKNSPTDAFRGLCTDALGEVRSVDSFMYMRAS